MPRLTDLRWLRALAALALWLGLADAARAQGLSFAPMSEYPVGTNPQWLVAADLNHDGVLDLAVANSGSSSVSVLLGTGGGAFRAAQQFPTAASPNSLVVADFNGDGVPDIATANYIAQPADVSLLLGNGDGTFQPPILIVGGGYKPYSVATGDFNHDGKPDLALANFGDDTPSDTTVTVLLGNGDGTFQAARVLQVLRGPLWVTAADVNGDGAEDIVAADFGGSDMISVLLGNNDGTFQAARHSAAGHAPASVAVGDFDHDGRADLAVADYYDNEVAVLRGNGDGTFQAPQLYAVGVAPTSVVVGDLDGNGALDIVAANWNGNAGLTFSVLLGNGDGTFQPKQDFTADRGVVGAIVADLDGDGFEDVVAANYNSGTVSVFINAAVATSNHVLTVARNGTGSGTVTSSPSGINCGATCSATYSNGTSVTLSAAPAAGSTFSGWSGAGCSGTGTCTVTLNADLNVTATFTPQAQTFTLSVSKAGTGTGTVTSSPSGINCGGACSASFNSGTVVTLSASPAAGSTFTGWSGGGCAGTGSCTVTMNASTSVTATFTVQTQTFTLSIGKAGSGSGTVTSSPSGINCGSACSASFNSGTVITLSASPAAGSNFTGWSGGGCAGTGSCTVTMNAAQAVTATFTKQRFTLSVTRDGLGSGSVTSSPAGINCGSDCSETYDAGTVITLTPQPGLLSGFAGWSGGGCSGTGLCTITIQSDVTVDASFKLLGLL